MYKGDSAHTGYTEERLNFPLKLVWKLVAAMTIDELGKQNPSSPVVENGVVYFCAGRRLYAVNAETGSLRWYYPTEALSSSIKTTPVVGKDLVYFGAGDGRVYAVTKDKGTLYWSFVTKGIVNSSPVLSDGVLYVGSGDDRLYALDAETGEPIWPGGFRVRDDVNSSPAVADGMVYFLSNDMTLYAANASPSTEKPKWAVQVGGVSRNVSPVVAENTVFVAAGNYLQAYQAKSGRLRWSLQLPNTITTTPAYANGTLFFGCMDGRVYAATTAGKIKWATPLDLGVKSYSSPVVAGDTVIIAANKGTVVALNAETGVMRWSYTILPSSLETGVKSKYVNIIASPAVSDGTLYVLADDGALYAFRYDAPDNTPPEVLRFTPPRDTPISGMPPVQIAAVFTDPGSGVRPDSISLKLDGEAVNFRLLPEQGIIYYNTPVTQPVVPLEDGLHTATLTLSDWAGNKTEMSWTFVIDNRIRRETTTETTTGGASRATNL
jgi:outer membrane protein assembly factor BamB